MGDAALVGLLKSGFDGLSPQLQEAARWVIDHPADVALLTTREQARRAGVAPATMTRLAQRIGLKGYDEIRKLYAEAVRRRPESFRARAEVLLQRRDTEGDAALVHDVLSSLAHHLQALTSAESIERFTAAAKLIAGAERVFCLGLRSSFAVAYIFHYVRSLFGASSVLVDGAGGTGVDLLRTIVSVTDSEMSPLAALAQETLIVRTETPSFFHTMAPAFAAVECLAALVAARRGSQTLAAIAASEKQLTAFDTFMVRPRNRRSRS